MVTIPLSTFVWMVVAMLFSSGVHIYNLAMAIRKNKEEGNGRH